MEGHCFHENSKKEKHQNGQREAKQYNRKEKIKRLFIVSLVRGPSSFIKE